MRVSFQGELDQLEASLQEEGELVLRVLRGALNALGSGDVELADDVISFDDDVDRLYLHIENEIESLLARQTPVATDLRLVLAMLHVNLHLERMADYSVTIAKLTKLVADVEPDAMLLVVVELDDQERGHIRDARGLLHVVRDDHERVILLEVAHQLLELLRRDRVQGRGRLVQK